MGALRNLTITQQVGLLFVALFGVLVLATLAAFSRTLRDELDDAGRRRHEQFRRDLKAVWWGAVLFWVSWVLGAVAATLLFGVVSFLAFREFITLTHTRRADHRSLLLAFFLVLPLQFVLAGSRHFDLFTVFVPVYVFFAIPVVSALGNDPQRFLERTAKIQWGIMVCIYGMSHAPALLLADLPGYAGRGAFLVFYLVVVVAAAQIAQELASRRLRRRPVARAISRSFSWRGWLIGAAVAAFVGAALYWATPFKPIPALVMGFVAGGTGTLGEFVMKALKRDAGVRSWGGKASVTGAVGLLDRVAPLCFAAPVFFHAVRWYFGLQTEAMRILGIDPGLRTTGFGVIEADGPRLSYVASGTIKTDTVDIGQLPARLKIIFDGVREVTARYRPTCAAMEIVFVNVNPQSTLLLGQARGAALTALVSNDLAVSEYTALQMKKAIVGHGQARKEQVQEMVMRLLKLPGIPGKDAADALGLAICHAHAGASFAAISQRTTLARRAHAQYKAGRTY